MKTVILLCLVSFLCNSVILADAGNSADTLFSGKGEIYIKVYPDSPSDLVQLSRMMSICGTGPGYIIANVNRKEFRDLLASGLAYEPLEPLTRDFNPVMSGPEDISGTKAWDSYPTYDAFIALMYQFQAAFPQLCQVFSIGQTVQGRQLLVARISDNVGVSEGEPSFFYSSTIHGDETTGYILMLHLIDYLLTGYGNIPRITALVSQMDIYISPLANPDGTYAGGNNTVSGAIRRNANMVDLNRNYPDPQAGPHPDGNVWQPETIAYMNFAENHHFVAGANLHGGAEVCNYPWDTWEKLAADDDWWVYVCREFADTIHAYGPTGYFDDLDNGITNGYAWYTITGGRQDYMNYFQQCREFTLEISATKLLPENQLISFWNYTYRSLLNFLEQSIYGLRGTVTDELTHLPLKAEVYILDHDIDSSWIYSDSGQGDYHRPLHEGTYQVRFSAPGYFPETYAVSVANRFSTTLDVELTPGTLVPDFSASASVIPTGGTVNFSDKTFGNPVSWNWTFPGGLPPSSTQKNPAGISYSSPGEYPVTLTVNDGTVSQTVTKSTYIQVRETFNMQNGSATSCAGFFSDSGGGSGNYSGNEHTVFTFYPGSVNGKIRAFFQSFQLEPSYGCTKDRLRIYDGPSTASPLLGTWCGSNSPGTMVSTHATGTLTFEFQSNSTVTYPGWSALIDCNAIPFTLQAKAFLQGPFNGTDMNTSLLQGSLVPLTEPFNTGPWHYYGPETMINPASDVVDWVLVELRNASSPAVANKETMLVKKAAIILKNGEIKKAEGAGDLQFNSLITEQLFAVIWHRNHLGVMSSDPLVSSGTVYSYDFSTGAEKVYGGGTGCTQLSPLLWGLTAGDGKPDGSVNNGDKNDVWMLQTGGNGYLQGDFNLDTQVNNIDKVSFWNPNTGKSSQVPE